MCDLTDVALSFFFFFSDMDAQRFIPAKNISYNMNIDSWSAKDDPGCFGAFDSFGKAALTSTSVTGSGIIKETSYSGVSPPRRAPCTIAVTCTACTVCAWVRVDVAGAPGLVL